MVPLSGAKPIPIYWEDIGKNGLSNCVERKKLFGKALEYFNLRGRTLLGNREYIGTNWFEYLGNEELGLAIRIKKNTYVDADCASGKTCKDPSARG